MARQNSLQLPVCNQCGGQLQVVCPNCKHEQPLNASYINSIKEEAQVRANEGASELLQKAYSDKNAVVQEFETYRKGVESLQTTPVSPSAKGRAGELSLLAILQEEAALHGDFVEDVSRDWTGRKPKGGADIMYYFGGKEKPFHKLLWEHKNVATWTPAAWIPKLQRDMVASKANDAIIAYNRAMLRGKPHNVAGLTIIDAKFAAELVRALRPSLYREFLHSKPTENIHKCLNDTFPELLRLVATTVSKYGEAGQSLIDKGQTLIVDGQELRDYSKTALESLLSISQTAAQQLGTTPKLLLPEAPKQIQAVTRNGNE